MEYLSPCKVVCMKSRCFKRGAIDPEPVTMCGACKAMKRRFSSQAFLRRRLFNDFVGGVLAGRHCFPNGFFSVPVSALSVFETPLSNWNSMKSKKSV